MDNGYFVTKSLECMYEGSSKSSFSCRCTARFDITEQNSSFTNCVVHAQNKTQVALLPTHNLPDIFYIRVKQLYAKKAITSAHTSRQRHSLRRTRERWEVACCRPQAASRRSAPHKPTLTHQAAWESTVFDPQQLENI